MHRTEPYRDVGIIPCVLYAGPTWPGAPHYLSGSCCGRGFSTLKPLYLEKRGQSRKTGASASSFLYTYTRYPKRHRIELIGRNGRDTAASGILDEAGAH